MDDRKLRMAGKSIDEQIVRYYRVNDVQKFRYSRPFHREPRDTENEFASLWLARTVLVTSYPLPGILRWFPVTAADTYHLSPLQNAIETMELFFRLLARFAGDMALVFGAKGGIFVGGGIAPRFRDWDWLTSGAFAAAARDRGHASGYLADIPIQLITAPDAALQGLAAVAAHPDGFALDFDQRCWC